MHADPRENERKLFEIASIQGGYFTAKQAVAAGYYHRLQNYHRSRGNWLPVDRGIFRLRQFPDTPREDLIRWSLWSCNRQGEPQAVFSHQTAVSFHELGDLMPAKIHFTVPPSFRKSIPGGCVVHRAVLDGEDIEEHSGFRVTTPVRSLIDCIEADVEPSHISNTLSDALRKGVLRMEDIRRRAKSKKVELFLGEYQAWAESHTVLDG